MKTSLVPVVISLMFFFFGIALIWYHSNWQMALGVVCIAGSYQIANKLKV